MPRARRRSSTDPRSRPADVADRASDRLAGAVDRSLPQAVGLRPHRRRARELAASRRDGRPRARACRVTSGCTRRRSSASTSGSPTPPVRRRGPPSTSATARRRPSRPTLVAAIDDDELLDAHASTSSGSPCSPRPSTGPIGDRQQRASRRDRARDAARRPAGARPPARVPDVGADATGAAAGARHRRRRLAGREQGPARRARRARTSRPTLATPRSTFVGPTVDAIVAEVEAAAARLGLADRVTITGRLDDDEYRRRLADGAGRAAAASRRPWRDVGRGRRPRRRTASRRSRRSPPPARRARACRSSISTSTRSSTRSHPLLTDDAAWTAASADALRSSAAWTFDDVARGAARVARRRRRPRAVDGPSGGAVASLTRSRWLTPHPPHPVPLVRVVVLNFDGGDMTLECLDSILASDWPSRPARRRDGRQRLARRRRRAGRAPTSGTPRCGCSNRSPTSASPAGATSASARPGDHEFVALVNNDATVDPGWLRAMVPVAQSDDRIGAVAAKMLFADRFHGIEFDVPDASHLVQRRARACSACGSPACASTASGSTIGSRSTRASTAPNRRCCATARSSPAGRAQRRRCGSPSDGSDAVDDLGPAVVPRTAPRHAAVGGRHRRSDGRQGRRVGRRRHPARAVRRDQQRRVEPVRRRLRRRPGIPRGRRRASTRNRPTCSPGAGERCCSKRAYLDDVGTFDERFFLYYEDTDLSWRGQLRGWRYVYEPDAVVRHRHAASSGVGSAMFRYCTERNRLLMLAKNAPWRLAWRSGLGEVRRARRPPRSATTCCDR